MKAKRLFMLLAVLCLGICLLTVTASASEVASGTCGDNLTWVLTDDGTLTISGQGPMEDFFEYYPDDPYEDDARGDGAPWYRQHYSDIVCVVIEPGVTTVGHGAFTGCENLSNVTLPDGLVRIGDGAFSCCWKLVRVDIPDGVTSIGKSAFYDCPNMTDILIPDSVNSIGNRAFYNCHSLKSDIIVPDGVTRIDDRVFDGCKSLTSITIPDSVTSIGAGAFNDCKSLKSIEIPDGVTDIGYSTFAWCESLESISIPDSVTSLGERAFEYCSSLKSVQLPKELDVICDNLFYRCISLDRIIIPDGVKYIGGGAFDNCISLESITIPASVREIDAYALSLSSSGFAFTDCGLKEVRFEGNMPSFGEDVFYGTCATAHYPLGRAWFEDYSRPSYGGSIYWMPYCPGHEYVVTVVEPTCEESGYTNYKCSICSEGYSDSFREPLGHNYVNNVCSRCGGRGTYVEAPKAKASNVPKTGKIKVSWNKVSGTAKYKVYRSTSKNSGYKLLTTTSKTSIVNTKVDAGKTYYYYVVAVAKDGTQSDRSSKVSRTCDLAQPVVKLSNVAKSGKIKISWNKVEGAVKYEVYRATSKNGTYTRIITTKGTSVTNTSAVAGKAYYYKVRAICSDSAGNSAYSEAKGRTCDLARPEDVEVERNKKGKPVVSWDKVSRAKSYKVYIYDANGKQIKTVTTTKRSMTHSSAVKNRTYSYRVVAIHSNSSANSAKSSSVKIKSR